MKVINLSKPVFTSAYCLAVRSQKQGMENVENLSFGGLVRQVAIGEGGMSVVVAAVKSSGPGIKLSCKDGEFKAWVKAASKMSDDFKKAAQAGNFARCARIAKRMGKHTGLFTSWLPANVVPTGNEGTKP